MALPETFPNSVSTTITPSEVLTTITPSEVLTALLAQIEGLSVIEVDWIDFALFIVVVYGGLILLASANAVSSEKSKEDKDKKLEDNWYKNGWILVGFAFVMLILRTLPYQVIAENRISEYEKNIISIEKKYPGAKVFDISQEVKECIGINNENVVDIDDAILCIQRQKRTKELGEILGN